jgi:hypothetical protein
MLIGDMEGENCTVPADIQVPSLTKHSKLKGDVRNGWVKDERLGLVSPQGGRKVFSLKSNGDCLIWADELCKNFQSNQVASFHLFLFMKFMPVFPCRS